MGLLDLRNTLLIEILCFLSPKELVTSDFICKKIRQILIENVYPISIHLKYSIGVDFFPEYITFLNLKRLVETLCTSEERYLQVLAYYTNGGVYANSLHYSMDRLFQKNTATYCTKSTAQNVLVKGFFNLDIQDPIPSLHSKYISPNEILLQDELKHAIAHRGNLKYDTIVTGATIRKLISGYTCPVRRFMLFISDSMDEDSEIIKKFYHCKNVDAVTAVARELGLDYECQDENNLVYFRKRNDMEIKPVFWVDDQVFSNRTKILNFLDKFVGCFCYALLIDSHAGQRNPNIDAPNIALRGFYFNYENYSKI